MTAVERARLGGIARAKALTPERRREIAHRAAWRGGRATKLKHGRKHFVAIGKKGFMVTVARHWGGDAKGYVKWLQARGDLLVADRLADLELARRADNPIGLRCVELPVYDDDVEAA